MKEQIKAIIYDFKDAGWTVQRVEQELGFSNGSLGKPISDFRFCKLLELHKKEIKKSVTLTKELEEKIAENNLPENKKSIEKERNTVNSASQSEKNISTMSDMEKQFQELLNQKENGKRKG